MFGVPADVSEAYLYEDDGDTTDWRGERRLELRFELRRSKDGLVLSVDTDGSYRPAFDTISVRTVAVDGKIRIDTSKDSAVKIEQGSQAFPV